MRAWGKRIWVLVPLTMGYGRFQTSVYVSLKGWRKTPLREGGQGGRARNIAISISLSFGALPPKPVSPHPIFFRLRI